MRRAADASRHYCGLIGIAQLLYEIPTLFQYWISFFLSIRSASQVFAKWKCYI